MTWPGLRSLVLAFLCLATLSVLTCGQTQPDVSIRDVNVCDVLRDASDFDGQVIRLRGQLVLEFEDATFDDDACGVPFAHTPVWWNFGGEPLLLTPQEAKLIQPLVSPVVRDASFNEFQGGIRARRAERPDGQICDTTLQCAFYDVTATFTGRFFAGRLSAGRKLPGGFGHMGCCHLFVIEKVADVVAKRTAVPTDDLKFLCNRSTWQNSYERSPDPNLSGIDLFAARLADNKKFLIDQAIARGDVSLAEAMRYDSFRHFFGLPGYSWSSPDLLVTYTISFPQTRAVRRKKKQQAQAAAMPTVANVTRVQCESTAN